MQKKKKKKIIKPELITAIWKEIGDKVHSINLHGQKSIGWREWNLLTNNTNNNTTTYTFDSILFCKSVSQYYKETQPNPPFFVSPLLEKKKNKKKIYKISFL